MRWWMSAALLSLSLGAAGSVSAADEWDVPQPSWEGVWEGTVGTAPIHVCLDKTPYDQKGAYYYDRIKRLLRLVPGKGAGDWIEQESYGKNGARWHIEERAGAISGSWSNGSKQLPLRLKRVAPASNDYEGPCGSMAFHKPRVAPVKLISSHEVKDGAAYTSWTFKPGPWTDDQVEVSTFTLDRAGAQVAKVNTILRSILPKPDGTGDWLDCIAAQANQSGMDGDFTRTIAPTLVSDHWLAADQQEDYSCGGAHPDGGTTHRLFDLFRGVEVDPLDWFGPTAVHREGQGSDSSKTLTAAFRTAILKGWKADEDECQDTVRTQDYWNVGLARGALLFSPELPHVAAACGEDIKVPLARLEPWLNASGKAAVATLPR